MHEITLLGVLLAGLLGSVHCAGMCGGIVTALSMARRGESAPWRMHLAYNAGRIASYTVAGTLVGLLGQGGLALRGTVPVQHFLFAVASTSLVLLGAQLAGFSPVTRLLERGGQLLWRRVEPWSRAFLPIRTPLRAAGAGMVWGWLPCGLVYSVLLLAFTAGTPSSGALTMLVFGLGTAPGMMGLGLAVDRRRSLLRDPVVRLVAGLLVAGAGIYGIVMLATGVGNAALFCHP